MDTVRFMKDNSVHIEDKWRYMNLNSDQSPTTSSTTRQVLWTNKGKFALAVFVGQAFVLLLLLVAKTSDVETFSEKIFKLISTRNDSSQLNSYNKEHTDAIKNIAKILEEKIASLEERQSILISNLTTGISNLQEQVASILSDVEDTSSIDTKIKLCVTRIKTGKLVEALELLDSFDNSTLISQIIRLAYDSNPANVQTILKFAKMLPRCSQDEIAYKTLFQEMQKSNASSMPEILLLFDATSSCATTLSTLRTEIKPFVNDGISSWTDEILSGNGESLGFWNVRANRNSMSNYVPNMIKSVYQGSLANFDSVLELINGLFPFPFASLGYMSLLTEMKISSDLFSYEAVRLLYKIKNQWEYSNFVGGNTQIQYINRLKDILPGNVFGLVWNGEKCTVQNVRYNDYIYPSINLVNGSREVFARVGAHKITGGDWKFRSRDGGISFLIKNTLADQYLIASDERRDSDTRFVYTRHDVEGEKAALWKIKPLNNTKFTLVSAMYNEYLFAWASANDEKNRDVFIRNGTNRQGSVSLEGQWRIEC